MKRRIFIKNLSKSLLSLFIPIIIFGYLSIYITTNQVREQLDINNLNLLKQSKENIELILNEADYINLNLLSYRDTIDTIGELSSKLTIDKNDYMTVNEIRKMIDASTFSRPYVKSIYIYFNNDKKKFFTNAEGFVSLEHYYDTLWFDSYNEIDCSKKFWIESRKIKQYDFERDRTKVITLYRQLNHASNKKTGVIVLNFYSDYIKSQLENLDLLPGQIIRIMDLDDNEVFSYTAGECIKGQKVELDEQIAEAVLSSEIEFDGGSYIVNQLQSDKYDLKYVSITPSEHLYSIPSKLKNITLFLLVCALFVGTLLAYIFTKKNTDFIGDIITIFELAEEGRPLPQLPSNTNGEYNIILYNIIRVFLDNNSLKTQLLERKYRLKAMELAALHSQINPHFLFNTLNTVYWKSMDLTGEHNEVSRMVECLSSILDYSLGDYEEFVTMEQEIENTKRYIEIQEIRYRDKFDVTWEYDNSIKNHRTIKLILQPLIENSIQHGVNGKEGRCSIKIKIKDKSDYFKISIIDNGQGITRQRLKAIRKGLEYDELDRDAPIDIDQGIGLYNTNRRIKLTYGAEYGVELNSKYGIGTAVYIYLPLTEVS